MNPNEIAFLAVAAFFTSALTAVVGAGGGTALIAIMLQIMPPVAAIPVHGSVQLVSNTWRVILLRDHLDWPIIVRFSVLMPFGVAVGLWLFQGLPPQVVQILIGCFVLSSLFARRLKRFRGNDVPPWAFVPIGFVTGILNMTVGVVAPVLGVLLARKDMTKEQVVGTLGVFGVVGNFLKVVGFGFVGFSFADYAWPIALIVPAALCGTSVGRFALGRMDERYFLILFQLVLIFLALKLIVYDGLARLM